jgi:hypothetical protein
VHLVTLLLAALVLAQGPSAAQAPVPSSDPILGPALPAGCNEAFQRLSLTLQEALEKGEFESAGKLYRMMPKLKFNVAWDDSDVPAELRESFIEARDRALSTWAKNYPNTEIRVVPFKKGGANPPDILFSFVPSLPARDEPIPPAAVHFFSQDLEEPRLETVISLKRGNPPVRTDYMDVHNEVGYAVTQFLGVERTISPGAFSNRTELPWGRLTIPGQGERYQVTLNVAVSDAIAKAILKKQKLIPARPALHMDPLSFDAGSHDQGEIVKFSFQVTNNGNAPLQIRTQPDCSCVSSLRQATLGPGETRLIPAQIDLTEFVGNLDKSIFVYSNDINRSVLRIPVKVRSNPLFRFLAQNDGWVLLEDGKNTARAFLLLPEGSTIKPVSAKLDGLEAEVTFKPWSGMLADPELNEGERPRNGYVFEVNLPDEIPPGQTRASLRVATDSPKFKEISTGFAIQKGIVASPDVVLYGEIPQAPRRSGFLLLRPRKDFEITKMTVDSPFLTLTKQAMRGKWEYRVFIQFDGKAPPGPLKATVTIHTNDPKQPLINVPVSAFVR